MADADLISNVRDLFKDVTKAAELYQQTRKDRDARNLARRVGNEEVLYDQFIRRLELLVPVTSAENGDMLISMAEELGLQSTDHIKVDLRLLEEFLRSLKADLTNNSTATQVLSRLRLRPPAAIRGGVLAKTPLQKRLEEFSRINKRLALSLAAGETRLPLIRGIRTALDYKVSLRKTQDKPVEVLRVVGARYSCACQESHATSLDISKDGSSSFGIDTPGTSDQSVEGENDRDREPTGSPGNISVSILRQKGTGLESQWTRELYQALPSATGPSKDSKVVRLLVEETQLPSDVVTLESFIERRLVSFDWKKRIDVAFQLSSAILLLWTLPLVDESLRRPEWDVWINPDSDEPQSLWVGPRSPAEGSSMIGGAESATSILSRDRVLAILGLRLMELAYGQPLSGMREDDEDLVGHTDETDKDLLDVVAANRLLALGRVGEECGQALEAVLYACLDQQYREQKDGAVRELSLDQPGFLDSAAIAILQPLYQEVRKNTGCRCSQGVVDEPLLGEDDRADTERVGSGADRRKDPSRAPETATPVGLHEGTGSGLTLATAADKPSARAVPEAEADAFSDFMDDASEHSVDSMAGTTSVMTWLSDKSDEPEPLPASHPFLHFRLVAQRIIFAAFQAGQHRAHGEGPSMFAGRGGPPESSKNPNNKRPRPQSEKNPAEDALGDEASGPTAAATRKKPKREEEPTLACPFFKKNSLTHMLCCNYSLVRIRDVKQHLYRRHQMPMYCSRCFATFRHEVARDNHVRENTCEVKPVARPEGITESQRRDLGRKVSSNLSEEEQWYGVFELLFPGEPRPASPYIVSGLMQDVSSYQRFMTDHGADILHEIITSNGRVKWNQPNADADERALRQMVLTDGMRAIFNRWVSFGGLPPPASGGHAPDQTAGGPAGLSQAALGFGVVSDHARAEQGDFAQAAFGHHFDPHLGSSSNVATDASSSQLDDDELSFSNLSSAVSVTAETNRMLDGLKIDAPMEARTYVLSAGEGAMVNQAFLDLGLDLNMPDMSFAANLGPSSSHFPDGGGQAGPSQHPPSSGQAGPSHYNGVNQGQRGPSRYYTNPGQGRPSHYGAP